MSSKVIKLSERIDLSSCSIAYGHFDNIHPGHIRYLKYAKSLGKILIVAVIGDPGNNSSYRFQFNQKERSETLAMLDIVDYIINLGEFGLFEVVFKLYFFSSNINSENVSRQSITKLFSNKSKL